MSDMNAVAIVESKMVQAMKEFGINQKPEEFDMLKSEYFKKVLANLHMNEDLNDFHFKFPSGERVPAQKCILSGVSVVFWSKLKGEWKGKTEVDVSDVSVGAFKEFLQLFYLGYGDFTMENVADVMALCKEHEKGHFVPCSPDCVEFLKLNINTENVCWGYGLAIKFNDKELKQYCEKIIELNANEVFATDGFKSCSRDVLANILNIKMSCPEVDVFNACMDWVKSISKQEIITMELINKHLGELFYKIRYGSMQLTELCKIIEKYGDVFSIEEYANILQMIIEADKSNECESNEKETVEETGEEVAIEIPDIDRDLLDVFFTFASGGGIAAYRCLLSAGSKVFRAKFNGEWNGKTDIKISDVSASAFAEFLQFFYTGDVKLSMKNVADVMRLCKKYEMDDCTQICGKFLKPRINDENVCWAYDLAIKTDANELKEYCEMIIGYNSKAVFASDGFKSCKRDVLANILEMTGPFCCREIELFEACMNWVKSVSKHNELTKEIVNEHLGELFYKIRFGLMSLSDIRQLFKAYSKLFSTNEYRKILQMIVSGAFDMQIFCKPRQPAALTPWNKSDLVRISRKRNDLMWQKLHNYPLNPVRNIEGSAFSSTEPLLLVGFSIAPICANKIDFENKKPNEYIEEEIPTEITIFEIDAAKPKRRRIVLQKEKAILNHKRSEPISLSKPIFIKTNFIYEIRMVQSLHKDCFVHDFHTKKSTIGHAQIKHYRTKFNVQQHLTQDDPDSEKKVEPQDNTLKGLLARLLSNVGSTETGNDEEKSNDEDSEDDDYESDEDYSEYDYSDSDSDTDTDSDDIDWYEEQSDDESCNEGELDANDYLKDIISELHFIKNDII